MTRDPVRTRSSILLAAVAEFAKEGFAGGRIDRIVAQAGCNQQMVYYYFGDKASLYSAVIEHAQTAFDESASTAQMRDDDPMKAVADTIQNVWSFYVKNPEYLSILHADAVIMQRKVKSIGAEFQTTSRFMSQVSNMVSIGVERNIFRSDADPFLTYISILALCVYYLVHCQSLSTMSGRDLEASAAMEGWCEHVVATVLAGLRPPGHAQERLE